MAIQQIQISKVGGKAGVELFERLRHWAGLRAPDEPKPMSSGHRKAAKGRGSALRILGEPDSCSTAEMQQWSTTEYPSEVQNDLLTLVNTLHSNACQPPILYHVGYVDMWSVGVELLHLYFQSADPAHFVLRLMPESIDVACYMLPDGKILQRQLEKALRSRILANRRYQERKWFVVNLLEAVRAWEGLCSTAAILITRRSSDISPSDSMVQVSMEAIPSWLQSPGTQAP